MNSIIREHPALVVTAGYFYVSIVGFLVSRKYLGTYKLNILDYAGAQDFLLEAIRNPWLFLASISVFIGIVSVPFIAPRLLPSAVNQSAAVLFAGFIYAVGITVFIPAEKIRSMIQDRQSLQCLYLTSTESPGYEFIGHVRQIMGLSNYMIFQLSSAAEANGGVLVVHVSQFHHSFVEDTPNKCVESDA